MCGILLYYNKAGIGPTELNSCLSALQKLKHRGPDGEGIALFNTMTGKHAIFRTAETPEGINCQLNDLNEIRNGQYNLLLGHRRLNIIDLSIPGHQPMSDIEGDVWIVFNGEIYNYLELNKELKTLGHKFKSHSDTEVIVEAYKEWGTECLNRFNGMWSIIIWDIKKRELIISNDRYGIKPLYHLKHKEEIIFASELKPFFSFHGKVKKYDYDAIHTYLDYGYINYNESTFFEEIKKFPSAHFATIKLDQNLEINRQKYYDISNRLLSSYKSEKDVTEEFNYLIKDAVRLTLRSDVPLGVAVSGGLDSSYILYTAKSLLQNETINSFSAIFPGSEGDESSFIKTALNGLNCDSHFVNPMEQFTFEDFEDHITSQEYPVQSTSFYADWCLSKLVKNKGITILLNGQGADELFAGYHHHFYKYCSELLLKGHISEYQRNVKEFCAIKGIAMDKVSTLVFNDFKQRVKSLFIKSRNIHHSWINALALEDLLYIDIGTTTLPAYLQSNDRSTMASSIESRLPFLDYRLVNFAMTLPSNYKIRDGWQKWMLRKAAFALPNIIRYRSDKKGFTTPERELLKKHRNRFEENLLILNDFELTKKTDFRHYSLALWLKHFKLNYSNE